MGNELKIKKTHSWIVSVSFFLLLAGFAVAEIVMPDKTISASERRYYEELPKLTWEAVQSGSYMKDMENYLLDQFVGRDLFRIAKTEIETTILGKQDANGYVKEGDYLFELDTDWSKQQVSKTAGEFAKLAKKWFADADVFYAVVSDKASFLPQQKYPVGDDGFVAEELKAQLTGAEYIDLYPYLSLDDYYMTDLHWKQESITDVAEVLLEAMNPEYTGANSEYETNLITDEFYGGYAGASAYQVKPDRLIGLTNEVISQATVYDYETGKEVSVYAPEKVDGTDPYDYYLWGARALLSIKNPMCENGKKLLVFRDSFGSSMAPLLLNGYEEITLVDLRYVTAQYLPNLISVEEYEDVLFLYSENVLRNSGSLKFK